MMNRCKHISKDGQCLLHSETGCKEPCVEGPCPAEQLEDEGRAPSKVLFSYGVDAVEVVRCRDCVYWSDNLYCADFYTMEPDGFCSWAKKRK